jgi:ribosomal protein S18 acetylase RimI-like enzyme
MPMNIASRPATEADVPHLARLYIAAFAGLMEAAYADSLAELPLEKIIEWRFMQRGSIRSYEHCLIALCDSRAAGMIYAFPIDSLEEAPSDPRLTKQGLRFLTPAFELHHQIDSGSYYISAVAVYPEFRGLGIGRRLMAAAALDAKRVGSPEISLLSFEQNEVATTLYKRLNFEITARSRVIAHALIRYTGDLLLMRRKL